MAIVPDPGYMTGVLMRSTETFTDANDAVHALLQVANPTYNLWLHRHVPGEGSLIPPEGLTGDLLKKVIHFATVGD